MSRIRLNKSTLSEERRRLKLYRKLLPSLDLKRRQLTVELARARRGLRDVERSAEELLRIVGEQLPMLANPHMTLRKLVEVDELVMGEENLLGVRLPVVERLEFREAPYSLLTKPAWVDLYAKRLREGVRLRVEREVAEERLALLERGTRRITQRVNLFERVLIPRSERVIQRIQIALGDRERDSVVRSKIAKAKQARRRVEEAV